ncbi:hypothetical protein D9619_007523 [Psilocybe cf. subviscida]|uniref:Uncharacterized protein n=1 Tax=Psilocybe cf. subviscida TaxID=2480587 RepID=A0A8H5B2A6_9AGAR|nr:hypothetical protein D9619_007523 [Psilocybe cf. subviscida]
MAAAISASSTAAHRPSDADHADDPFGAAGMVCTAAITINGATTTTTSEGWCSPAVVVVVVTRESASEATNCVGTTSESSTRPTLRHTPCAQAATNPTDDKSITATCERDNVNAPEDKHDMNPDVTSDLVVSLVGIALALSFTLYEFAVPVTVEHSIGSFEVDTVTSNGQPEPTYVAVGIHNSMDVSKACVSAFDTIYLAFDLEVGPRLHYNATFDLTFN